MNEEIGGVMDHWYRMANCDEDAQYLLHMFWKFHDFRIQNINYSPNNDRVDLILECDSDNLRVQLRFIGICDFNMVPIYDYPSEWLVDTSLFVTDQDEVVWSDAGGLNHECQMPSCCTWIRSKELHYAVIDQNGIPKEIPAKITQRSNKPWVVMQPATAPTTMNAIDVAVDFMDEYADVFAELAK